jgi:hypothetical protein
LASRFPSVATALEGTRQPAAGPAGGIRLTRLTVGLGGRAPLLAVSEPAPGDPGPDVRRLTGSLPSVGR